MDAINRFGKVLYNDMLPNYISSKTNNMKAEKEYHMP